MDKQKKKTSKERGPITVKETHSYRTFSYTRDSINLNFTLNMDNYESLLNFKILLDEAKKDIDNLLPKQIHD